MRTSARRAMSLWSHKAAFPSSPPLPTSSSSSSSSSSTIQLVLLRHGESEWNASKRFSGWTDVSFFLYHGFCAARETLAVLSFFDSSLPRRPPVVHVAVALQISFSLALALTLSLSLHFRRST